MKIVVLASTYPRWENDSVPLFVFEQLMFLKRYYPEIEMILITPHHSGAALVEKSGFGEVRRFRYFFPEALQKLAYPAIMPNLQSSKWLYLQVPFFLAAEFLATLKVVLREKPDYLYSHWFIPQGLVGGLVGVLTNTRHVFTSHSSDVMVAKRLPLLGSILVRFFTKKSSKITVVSKRSYEKLRSFFDNEQWNSVCQKVQIIPMGIDAGQFGITNPEESVSNKIDNNQQKSTLLFMGRLVEKKGLEYLFRALGEYKSVTKDFELIVAGDGPLLNELKTMVRGLKLDSYVRFVGFVTGERKVTIIKASDILLVPSIITDSGDAEGLPVSLMEGLMAGKICVASDASGADDILQSGKDGFLVRQKNSTDILEALKAIRNLSRSEKLEISKNAIEKGLMFDWSTIVTRHVKHLFS